MSRDRITSSMLGELAKLGSDAQRDQVERRIQSADKPMKYVEVRSLVGVLLDRGKSLDGRTTDTVVLCTKLYEKLERQTAALMSLLNDGVQLEGGLFKASKKSEAEIPKAVLQRRKETLSLVNRASKALDKYAGFVESHDL